MAMKEIFTLTRSPKFEAHHQMQFIVILRTPFFLVVGGSLTPSTKDREFLIDNTTPGSKDNESLFHTPQISRNTPSPSDSLLSCSERTLLGGLTPSAIGKILTRNTTPGQTGPGNNDNEWVISHFR